MTAIEISGNLALVALGLLTLNLLMGLLLSVGYNPLRQWPRRRIKLFTLHNWTGYIALSAATLHPLTLLLSTEVRFRLFDLAVPTSSPVQPFENTLGAIAWYLVAFVVLTSYFRTVFGRRWWKRLHYTAYAAATMFFWHGLVTDPRLKNNPVDWIDAEKVFVELCALAVAAATVWRIVYGRKRSDVRHRTAAERAAARRALARS